MSMCILLAYFICLTDLLMLKVNDSYTFVAPVSLSHDLKI